MSSQIFSCLRKGARRHWCVLYFSILIAVPKKQRKAFILREAIFKSNAFEQTIDATAIHSMSDYQENYRGNLYCCTPGCPAKVKWVSHNGKMPFLPHGHTVSTPQVVPTLLSVIPPRLRNAPPRFLRPASLWNTNSALCAPPIES